MIWGFDMTDDNSLKSLMRDRSAPRRKIVAVTMTVLVVLTVGALAFSLSTASTTSAQAGRSPSCSNADLRAEITSFRNITPGNYLEVVTLQADRTCELFWFPTLEMRGMPWTPVAHGVYTVNAPLARVHLGGRATGSFVVQFSVASLYISSPSVLEDCTRFPILLMGVPGSRPTVPVTYAPMRGDEARYGTCGSLANVSQFLQESGT